jgi:hypothetical protein
MDAMEFEIGSGRVGIHGDLGRSFAPMALMFSTAGGAL